MTACRNIILILSLGFLLQSPSALAGKATAETLQKCQIKGAQSLIKKYKLTTLPLKIDKPEACGKSFCASFEVIRRGSFQNNLLPVGSKLYVCESQGLRKIERPDGKALNFDKGVECKGSAEFADSKTVSCTLSKPLTVQGVALPAETAVYCLKDGASLKAFQLKADTMINGQTLKSTELYTFKKSQIEVTSNKSCKTKVATDDESN